MIANPDGTVTGNHTKTQSLTLPTGLIAGNQQVTVRTKQFLNWHKQSLPEFDDWEAMRADPDLKKELGETWFQQRSRIPRSWREKLNQRRFEKGQPKRAAPGRKRHLES